jgi:uncharacterized protein (TIGR03437 family)
MKIVGKSVMRNRVGILALPATAVSVAARTSEASRIAYRRWLQIVATMAWVTTAPLMFAQAPGYNISTVPGTFANFLRPEGFALDSSGNLFFISNNSNSTINKISPSGVISTVAGSACTSGLLGDGGPASSACFSGPTAIAVDAGGNLYIADTGNRRIRKVLTNGTITTVAGPGSTNGALGDGGPATAATLSFPQGVTIDIAGNLYVSDTGNQRVRKVTTDGTITTFAGNGSSGATLGDGGLATSASLSTPTSVAVDSAVNLYIVDSQHFRIREVSTAGIITTVAGVGSPGYSGDGGLAVLSSIASAINSNAFSSGLAVDSKGNIFFLDTGNDRVRLITTDGKINTIAGNGMINAIDAVPAGPATAASPYISGGMAVRGDGAVFFGTVVSGILQLTPSGTQVFPKPSISGVASASGWGTFTQLGLGSWINIYGSYLAYDSRGWAGADFNGPNAPMSLDGTSVTIGGQPAFVSYISPGQMNAQVPSNAGTGMQQVVVTTTAGQSAASLVIVNGTEPGLLAPPQFQINSIPYVVAINTDGTYVLPAGAIPGVASRPARAGDTITLYGIGFGPVTPNVPAGQIVASTNALVYPFQLFIGYGSTPATVAYAGLAPGEVGLYQFNVVVPPLPVTGYLPIRFTLDAVAGPQSLYLSTQ